MTGHRTPKGGAFQSEQYQQPPRFCFRATGEVTIRFAPASTRQDAGNARQQAARGTFDPAYLNYTMGKLMIRKLREDWTASRGGKQAWQSFHDEFLKYGGPPIPLVRKAMLGGDTGSLF